MSDNPRFINRSELLGIAVLALLLVVILPLCLDVFRLNLVAKYLTYSFVAIGLVLCWGYGGNSQLSGAGRVLRPRRLLHGDVSEIARGIRAPPTPKSSRRPASLISWTGIRSRRTAEALFWKLLVPQSAFRDHRGVGDSGASRLHRRRGDVHAARRRRLFRDHHPGGCCDHDDPDRRPAGLYRWHQWHDRPAHARRMGHPRRITPNSILYFVFEVACLFGCIFIAQFIRHSKLGRILVAMREKEDRVRFSGYSVANFKIFAFWRCRHLRRHRRR